MKSRKHIFINLNTIKKDLEKRHGLVDVVAYVVPTPIHKCIERDALRKRTVGVDVIQKYYYSFQMPQRFEGFDKIIIHDFDKINHKYSTINPLLAFMINFDQKNPHHIYPLNIHCDKLAENYKVGSPEYVAGKLHDIGKTVTQTFDDKGIAHYYCHDSVGAYEVLCHLDCLPPFDIDRILYILFLINWHMRGHKDLRTPKAERKYRSLLGNNWYEALIQFADYDIIASGTSDKHEELMVENS